jgi:hypothetical protein
MRMSVEIADELLEAAIQAAATRHTTLRALLEEELQRILHDDDAMSFRPGDASVSGAGARGWHQWTDDQRTAAMYRGIVARFRYLATESPFA